MEKIRINKPIVNLQLKWTTLQGSRIIAWATSLVLPTGIRVYKSNWPKQKREHCVCSH